VTFPGGAELGTQVPGAPDPTEVAKGLLAQANAALAPLGPIFNTIDVIVAIFKLIKTIPDALGPPPDLSAIAQLVPDIAEKVDELLPLIPQLSVPVLVAGILDTLLFYLEGLRDQLVAIIAAQARITAAAARAAELGNV